MPRSDALKRCSAALGAAALGAAVLALAGGCGASEPNSQPITPLPRSSSAPPATPTQPTAAPEPTAAPTYINAAPGEAPPVRPPDELSDAGLEAFVRYFAQAADWVIASMDPTLLDEASASDCGLCTAVITSIREDVAAGRRYEGGRYTLVKVSVNPDLSPDGTRRNVGIWWDETQYTIFEPDGSTSTRHAPASNEEYALDARFRDGRWSVTSMLLVQRQQ